jgi:single-stranded-DNA-specific exonuclease
MEKRWIVKPKAPQEFKDQFSQYSPIILNLLYDRDIRTQEDIEQFLNPQYEQHVHDPFLFDQMEVAVKRVFDAIAAQERIVIHGDYDADGLSGAVILSTTLKKLGATDVEVFLPHREKDGYGINTNTINLLHQENTRLIITTDCGISNIDEITEAKALGMDVIVTDHHTTKPELPPCIILHPKVPGETYPFKDLAGGGVAFKLAQGLLRTEAKDNPDKAEENEGFEKWLLDMVAIASVADMVPLIGENRALVKYGLVVLQRAKRPGMYAMLTLAGVIKFGKIPQLGTYHIGFVIGPRMNAAGRMAHANAAYATLMSEDENEAMKLAEELETTNRERRKITEDIYKAAITQIGPVSEDPEVLIARDKDWPMGVVGLIAGRIMERYHRPVFILSEFDGKIAGSGRSIEGYDCTIALDKAKDILLKYGGHPRACGFTIADNDHYPELVQRFNAYARESLTKEDLFPKLEMDAELKTSEITWDFYDELEKLKPFGQGNPEPLFVSYGAEVVECDGVGEDKKHLRLSVTHDGKIIRKGIAFSQKYWVEKLIPGTKIDLVYTLEVNEWKNNKDLQLMVKEIRYSKNK